MSNQEKALKYSKLISVYCMEDNHSVVIWKTFTFMSGRLHFMEDVFSHAVWKMQPYFASWKTIFSFLCGNVLSAVLYR